MEEKADGYVAWHPKHGCCSAYGDKGIRTNRSDAWYQLCDLHGQLMTDSRETDKGRVVTRVFRDEMKSKGWRIRPVKLVFLDDPQRAMTLKVLGI